MPVTTGVRLDLQMVRCGLARSRGRAAQLVAEGRVLVAGAPARKPSQTVGVEDLVQVAAGQQPEYVSRAAHKLLGALDAIDRLAPAQLKVRGARCLDAGASTGGFTQVLLERGAKHVLAVDVGHGQIADLVATDLRVTVRERTNIRDLRPEDLCPAPNLVVADLSFISLTLVVRPLVSVTVPGGHLLLMVKPQFEVGRERLGARGVVSSNDLRHEAVLKVAQAALVGGARVRGVVPSVLAGSSGNREFFLWLEAPGPGVSVVGTPAASVVRTPAEAAVAAETTAAVEDAVAEAVLRDRAALVVVTGTV